MTRAEWSAFVADKQRQGDSVSRHVLDRADMLARWSSEATELGFKQDVAARGWLSDDSYEAVCRCHPCKGEEVPNARLTPHLLRVHSEDAWMRSTAGTDPTANAVDPSDPRGPGEGSWRRADALADAPTWPPALPQNTSVFGNLHPADPDPAATSPRPRILDEATKHVGLRGSLADVLIWLTARKGAWKGKAMVLVSYGRRHVGNCHYPVPPDAPAFERFRPVPPGCEEPYGRSWPRGLGEQDHLKPGNGVPEVVHPNVPVPMDDVWCLGLGRTALDTTGNG